MSHRLKQLEALSHHGKRNSANASDWYGTAQGEYDSVSGNRSDTAAANDLPPVTENKSPYCRKTNPGPREQHQHLLLIGRSTIYFC
jgi:hypothetical protein